MGSATIAMSVYHPSANLQQNRIWRADYAEFSI